MAPEQTLSACNRILSHAVPPDHQPRTYYLSHGSMFQHPSIPPCPSRPRQKGRCSGGTAPDGSPGLKPCLATLPGECLPGAEESFTVDRQRTAQPASHPGNSYVGGRVGKGRGDQIPCRSACCATGQSGRCQTTTTIRLASQEAYSDQEKRGESMVHLGNVR